jgi:hypothetical protein
MVRTDGAGIGRTDMGPADRTGLAHTGAGAEPRPAARDSGQARHQIGLRKNYGLQVTEVMSRGAV